MPECPSFTARLHHIINKEEVCDKCSTFFLEYHRNRRANPTRRRQCPRCGGGVNGQKYTHCSNCRRAMGERRKRKRRKRKTIQVAKEKILVGWKQQKGILIPLFKEVEKNVKAR